MESGLKKNGLVSPLRQVNTDGTQPPALTLKERYLRKVKRAYDIGGWDAVNVILSRTWDNTTLDDLTGLYNRGMFFKLLKKIVLPRMRRIAQVGGEAVIFGSVVYVDMDMFKQINERFGHSGGDEVLRTFARMIEVHFREDDVIGRVGGDEFIAVAVGLNRRDVLRRMIAIKREFEGYSWELIPVDPDDVAPCVFSFTFNVLKIENPEKFEEQMNNADTNVLRLKRNRRQTTTDL